MCVCVALIPNWFKGKCEYNIGQAAQSSTADGYGGSSDEVATSSRPETRTLWSQESMRRSAELDEMRQKLLDAADGMATEMKITPCGFGRVAAAFSSP